MGWTKQQLIEQAYEELALAGFVYDLSPELLESGLRRMDTMMAQWSAVGIAIGYLLPTSPDESDISSDSGIPDTAVEAVYMNLAVKIAASRGKTLTADTRAAAARAYNQLLGVAVRAAARPQCMPNTMPMGAGNKPWRNGTPFFPGPEPTLDAENGDPITV